MQRADKILIPGCGNSDFSSDLFDSGCKYVTNIDFSDLVIQEMAIKNALREEMQWLVMDMTKMTFPDHSFDVVFDKGGLDALMASDTEDVRQQANAMFAEIARVTKPGGKYLCVTLAEPFIIHHLLQHFLAAGWTIRMDVVTECGGREVPFVPFFVSIEKPLRESLDRKANEVYPVQLGFNSFGERNKWPVSVEPNDAIEQLRRVQSYQQRQHDLVSISVGRFEKIDLWTSVDTDSHVSETVPKYTLTILDHQLHAPRFVIVSSIPHY